MYPLRKKKRKTNLFKSFYEFLTNLWISILVLVVSGFALSFVVRNYNNQQYIEYPDLSTLITQTKYEKKTGHKIEIEIRNGCGAPKLAKIYTDFLRSQGFDVLDSKNADHFNYDKTAIIQHRGPLNRAKELAKIMSLKDESIQIDLNEELFYDLTLILGKDYMTLESYKKAIIHHQPY
tara:strand:- start:11169 stop:11702 length:534 start_codon:yes stop_codon:yes gene_type:complete